MSPINFPANTPKKVVDFWIRTYLEGSGGVSSFYVQYNDGKGRGYPSEACSALFNRLPNRSEIKTIWCQIKLGAASYSGGSKNGAIDFWHYLLGEDTSPYRKVINTPFEIICDDDRTPRLFVMRDLDLPSRVVASPTIAVRHPQEYEGMSYAYAALRDGGLTQPEAAFATCFLVGEKHSKSVFYSFNPGGHWAWNNTAGIDFGAMLNGDPKFTGKARFLCPRDYQYYGVSDMFSTESHNHRFFFEKMKVKEAITYKGLFPALHKQKLGYGKGGKWVPVDEAVKILKDHREQWYAQAKDRSKLLPLHR